MNLPNYFLADLPPEATLSPAMIAEACQTLKRNREHYLMNRSTESLISVLSDVADGWLEPENPFRKLALELGPAQTGFSRETLARGLDNFFKQLTRENFHALLVQEFGDAKRLDAMTATTAEQKQNRIGHRQRAGISSSHRRGQHSEPDADQHRVRLAHALGAICEVRERRDIFAAIVRALDLRSRPKARRVPGNRRMARRKC